MSITGKYRRNPTDQASFGQRDAFRTLRTLNGFEAPTYTTDYAAQYQDPFQEQVIDFAHQSGSRALDTAMDRIGADAHAAGAFGGSRHGLVESQAIDDYVRSMGELGARLGSDGFRTANELGLRHYDMDLGKYRTDVDNTIRTADALSTLAGRSFETGRAINADQLQAGSLAQMLQQAIIDNAGSEFGRFVGSPTSALQTVMGALGANPLSRATSTSTSATSSHDAGFGEIFGNILSALGNSLQFEPIDLF